MITSHLQSKHKVTLTLLTITTTMSVMLAVTATAHATAPPVKLALSNHIAGGFEYPDGVAVENDATSSRHGDVYVADKGNHRVQVLTATGAFVEMFGSEVNAKTKGNLCTAAPGEPCQAGVNSAAAGLFSAPYSITIDPSSGDVFIAEYVFTEAGFGLRVQKLTADGAFLYEIGKEVNTTKDKEAGATEAEKNLCSETEIEKGGECGGPASSVPGSGENSAFNFESGRGDLLAVGGTGANDLLYVGDESRVQEFEAASGKWFGEISLTSIPAQPGSKVQEIAYDSENGNVYIVYPGGNRVYEFNPEGKPEPLSIPVKPRHEGREVVIEAMALDGSGHLAVVAEESVGGGQLFGVLYDASTGHRISGFATPAGATEGRGLGFSSTGNLYAFLPDPALEGNQEVLVYEAQPIAELTIGSSACGPGAEYESSATFACTLNGEANPEGASETEAWFEYGRTPALGEKTPVQAVATVESLHVLVSLSPNETYYYQLAGFDHNLKPPEEAFASEQAVIDTPLVAPSVFGVPAVSVVRPSSAALFGELDPNNAHTEYLFQYSSESGALAKCAGLATGSCPGVEGTPVLSSAVYGKIGAVAEVSGLQSSKVYYYRLVAEDESRISPIKHFFVTGPEGSFETALAPQPSAQTGAYSTVTSTSATITGAVNPDGVPAGYAFELGVYNGAGTQYTIVYSAEAGSGNAPVEESLPVTGLQPGTTYAYRIDVSSGYIANEAHALQGAPVTFTTGGVPTVLASPASLATLAVPAIAFPKEEKGSGTTVKTLTNKQKLAKALAACHKQKGKKRASCIKGARKKYASVKRTA
jgi:NHL repeat